MFSPPTSYLQTSSTWQEEWGIYCIYTQFSTLSQYGGSDYTGAIIESMNLGRRLKSHTHVSLLQLIGTNVYLKSCMYIPAKA